MRIDRLRIGSDAPHSSHQFKNLKNVVIDFDEEHWVTVLIGWNGTGKSNVLEALAVIFRDLIEGKARPAFAYEIIYRMGSGASQRQIRIDADPERASGAHQIDVAAVEHGRGKSGDAGGAALPGWRRLSHSAFIAGQGEFLPRFVFSYYSGESKRLQDVFRSYLEAYDKKLRGGKNPGLKRLFYALPVHSQYVLLAFLTNKDAAVREVLDELLGLDPEEGLESVLFVLREPPWKSRAPGGDSRFWNARGVVQSFLDRLYEVALAPTEVQKRVATSLWNEKELLFKYLFVKDIAALRALVGKQPPGEFFRDLESTHVSELIEEVRIKVRLKKNDGVVTFRELSEGEQQLLTVLGLLRFTADEESLFLLDEPDTHLNPRWCVDYLALLKKFVATKKGVEENSHIVLTTHNPLAVAELVKEQVQILQLRRDENPRRVVAFHPGMDPRGLGYAAIVTSDMFGIASSLDAPTQHLLEKQRVFSAKDRLLPSEQAELDRVNADLSRLGFRFFHPDEEYSRYLRLRNDALIEKWGRGTPEELAGNAVAMSREDREELARRLIDQMIKKDRYQKSEQPE